MSFNFAEGTRLHYSNTLASPVTVTAVTNANPAVATATSHGLVDGDVVLFSSGWDGANDRVFVVNQLTVDTFEFNGLDTSSTALFPAAGGVGTVRKISNWVEVPQLLDITMSGGEPRFTTISLLASRNDIQVATGFNAATINFTLAHDPTNQVQKDLVAITEVLGKAAIRLLIGGSAPLYGYGNLALSSMPTMSRNQVNQVSGALSLGGRPTAYGS
jgi:hypothetical protein